jgi:hypothetical protein
MKMLSLAAAAAIAVSGLTASPSLAQPGRYNHGGDNHGSNMRHNANWQDDDHANNGNHYGWNNHRHQVCHWEWRHHHRYRECRWTHR